MSAFCTEMAELAQAMRNFLHAVDARAELSVNDAMAMLEAWHGTDAALIAMSQAEAADAADDPIDAAFWMDVYEAFVGPLSMPWTSVTIH